MFPYQILSIIPDFLLHSDQTSTGAGSDSGLAMVIGSILAGYSFIRYRPVARIGKMRVMRDLERGNIEGLLPRASSLLLHLPKERELIEIVEDLALTDGSKHDQVRAYLRLADAYDTINRTPMYPHERLETAPRPIESGIAALRHAEQLFKHDYIDMRIAEFEIQGGSPEQSLEVLGDIEHPYASVLRAEAYHELSSPGQALESLDSIPFRYQHEHLGLRAKSHGQQGNNGWVHLSKAGELLFSYTPLLFTVVFLETAKEHARDRFWRDFRKHYN